MNVYLAGRGGPAFLFYKGKRGGRRDIVFEVLNFRICGVERGGFNY